jgi:hypothetical protein
MTGGLGIKSGQVVGASDETRSNLNSANSFDDGTAQPIRELL